MKKCSVCGKLISDNEFFFNHNGSIVCDSCYLPLIWSETIEEYKKGKVWVYKGTAYSLDSKDLTDISTVVDQYGNKHTGKLWSLGIIPLKYKSILAQNVQRIEYQN